MQDDDQQDTGGHADLDAEDGLFDLPSTTPILLMPAMIYESLGNENDLSQQFDDDNPHHACRVTQPRFSLTEKTENNDQRTSESDRETETSRSPLIKFFPDTTNKVPKTYDERRDESREQQAAIELPSLRPHCVSSSMCSSLSNTRGTINRDLVLKLLSATSTRPEDESDCLADSLI
ncbi:hypothetical protein CDV36_003377 [Fusarium kuroshium]|uniref:Uncharacterized protein n=1 Tax=Fusarium kuroshium TaxID=2010991 RepID=A0A3M2SHF7_9HYPO|nr:hypothetical protein CDV36_003377 [Fusarium kuroshium]